MVMGMFMRRSAGFMAVLGVLVRMRVVMRMAVIVQIEMSMGMPSDRARAYGTQTLPQER